MDFRRLRKINSAEHDANQSRAKTTAMSAADDPESEDSALQSIRRARRWAGNSLAADGSLRNSMLILDVFGVPPVGENGSVAQQSFANLANFEHRDSVFDLCSFMATSPPALETPENDRSHAMQEHEHERDLTKLSADGMVSCPDTPLKSPRGSGSTSYSSNLFTPESSFENSSRRRYIETPPTPVTPVSPIYPVPPPKFSLRSSNEPTKRHVSIVHNSHEVARTRGRTHITDGANLEEEAQLMGLGFCESDADIIFRSTGRALLEYSGPPGTDALFRHKPNNDSANPHELQSTSLPPPLPLRSKKRLERKVTLPIQAHEAPVQPFPKRLSSRSTVPTIDEEEPLTPTEQKNASATITEINQSFESSNSTTLETESDADILKPLLTISHSPSAQKFRQSKKLFAEKALKSSTSIERLDWWKKTKSLVHVRSKLPIQPQDRPIDGYPSVRPAQLQALPMEISVLRVKHGVGLLVIAIEDEPTHPNHPFVWNTRNVWCTQCMLDPSFIDPLSTLEAGKNPVIDANEPPSDLMRSVPVTCHRCNIPCCVWAERQFFLHDTARNFLPHPALREQANVGAVNDADSNLVNATTETRGKLVKARIEAHADVKEIERACFYGRDATAFVRCTECGELVCPGCAGKCPEYSCGLIRCKACVLKPWSKCSAHGSGSLEGNKIEREIAAKIRYGAERNVTGDRCRRGKLPTPPKGYHWQLPG